MSQSVETTGFGNDFSVSCSGIMSSASAQSPAASASPSAQLKCTTGSPGILFDSEIGNNANQTNKPSSLRPRSCLPCRPRKVRCNKEQPCSTCSRSFISCVYPIGRAPFRKPPSSPSTHSGNLRPSEKELIERMRKLEDIVAKLSVVVKTVPANKSSPTPHFQHDAIENQSPSPDSPLTSLFEDFPCASSSQGPIGPHVRPGASAGDQHAAPTTTTPDSQNRFALVLVKYYGAIVFLEPDEILSSLGQSKDEALARYCFAVQQALSRANFLTISDITVLQALSIFVTVVRHYDQTRLCWSLTGLVIHLACGMGLHRDRSYLDLNSFEREMHRLLPIKRLWLRVSRHRAREIVHLAANPEEACRLDDNERTAPIIFPFGEELRGQDRVIDLFRERWYATIRAGNTTMPVASESVRPARTEAPGSCVPKPVPSHPQTHISGAAEGSADAELCENGRFFSSQTLFQSPAFPLRTSWPLPLVDWPEMNDLSAGERQRIAGQSNEDMTSQETELAICTNHQETRLLGDNPPLSTWSSLFPTSISHADELENAENDMFGDNFDWQGWAKGI
ncbi:hypothetical protein AUP68_02384 [Ilyonectria robusta]